jgi:hypothetical protein
MHAEILASPSRDTILSVTCGDIHELFVELGANLAFYSSFLAYNITDTSCDIAQNTLGVLGTQYRPSLVPTFRVGDETDMSFEPFSKGNHLSSHPHLRVCSGQWQAGR